MLDRIKVQIPVNVAVFASGGGSNARKITEYLSTSSSGRVSLLVSNNQDSGVFELAKEYNIPSILIERGKHRDGNYLIGLLEDHKISLIALAGYLKLIPEKLVQRFQKRILNVHPSLLPSYGGKGMYGMNVHEAVISQKEPVSGMTIHFIDEIYDRGEIIFQANVVVQENWSPVDLQKAVLKLEHQYYPKIVEQVCESLQTGSES